jgi:hypothetical protein
MRHTILRAVLGLATVAATLVVGGTQAQAQPSDQSIDISDTTIFSVTPNGTVDAVGYLLQWYVPSLRSAYGYWNPTGDYAVTGGVWLENGPHTHTLISSPINPGDQGVSTGLYAIDRLSYPKTIDAAVHVVYTNDQGRTCDLWVASQSHDYSTGGTYGGSPTPIC